MINRHITRATTWRRKHSPQSLAWERPPHQPVDAEAWRRMLSPIDVTGRKR